MVCGWRISWFGSKNMPESAVGAKYSPNAFFAEKVWDFLFPKFCAGCGEEGQWLCERCLPVANFTQEERGDFYLDGIASLFIYEENTISRLIKMFKYDYLMEIAGIFKKIIDNTDLHNIWRDFVIIPAPLHARRERERGFNQSEIIANLFAEKFGLSVNKNLRRVIYTAQQAKLSAEERKLNLENAFVWADQTKLAPKKILIVDDVFTTGATMQECAKVLKNSGAKIVWGLVLASG